MSAPDFHVVRVATHDRPTVLRMLAEYLPGADVVRRYEWLYERNPHGRVVTFLALGNGGTPVGFTSLFPRRAIVDGVLRVGSVGGDGYVRPAFRRRGIVTALHRACLESMRSVEPGGIEFMYGAPVKDNLAALLRAGSRRVTSLRRFARPRPVHRILSLVARLAGRIPARLAPLSAGDGRAAEVWERAKDGARVMPVRDPAHYAWRFGASPAGVQRAYAVVEGGRTVAVCALERRGRSVAILDLLAPPGRYAPALRATANAVDADLLTMCMNEDAPPSRDLWRAGFLGRESKAFQVMVPDEHPAAAALLDPKCWYYTWGDGDLDRIL
jgi:RimJ/RimL family protein N-acetyltransferase